MALVELYRETGEKRYLDLAQHMMDVRGKGALGGNAYHQDHKPFRELSEVTGHAVRAVYLNAGATDLFMETGDSTLKDALERIWQNMATRRMYVNGGLGARYAGEAFGADYELPNETAYSETCAAIAGVLWNWRMLQVSGEERFTDLMELGLYNGVLSGISLDGKEYFYVNPLASRGNHRRRRWFDCACCPPNMTRAIGWIPGMLYSTSDDGIWAHLYASSTAEIPMNGGVMRLTQTSGFPWEGNVEIRIESDAEREFSLHLRIPKWTKDATIGVNGSPAGVSAEPGSYLSLKRLWKRGDTVRLTLPMARRFLAGHPRIESAGGRVALLRGPMVYCLEAADNPDADVWSVELDTRTPIQTRFRADLFSGVSTENGSGYATDAGVWEGKLYLDAADVDAAYCPATFTAIPYYAWANRDARPMTLWILRAR